MIAGLLLVATATAAAGTPPGEPKALPAAEPSVTADTPPAAPEAQKRAYYLKGSLAFRMRAISDEDPITENALLFGFEGGYSFEPGWTAFLKGGVSGKGWYAVDNAAVHMTDSLLGVRYRHSIDPDTLGLDVHDLHLQYEAGIYLPTSSQSILQSMYLAPDANGTLILELTEKLSFELELGGNYRFHKYAERAGLSGLMNTQLALYGSVYLEAVLFDIEGYGNVNLAASAQTSMVKRYASRDDHPSPTSDPAVWLQDYGWGAYLGWLPTSYLSFTISLEQNAPVLRDGLVNVFFTKLEDTELVFTLGARY